MAAGEDQVLGLGRADQPGQPLGAARTGDQTEHDLGLAQLGVVGGDPEVGAERQFAATTERVAGDRGDDRLGDPGHRGEGVLQRLGPYDHRRVVHRLHLLDVRARREHLLAAVEDDGAHIVAPGRLLGEFTQPVLGGDIQGVHGRTVQPDRADAVACFEGYGHGKQVNRR